MIHQPVEIVNKLGLHARAAAKLVTLANQFEAQVELLHDNHRVNGKSIMGVMMLAATQGTTLTLSTDGADEAAASKALVTLIGNRFGEDE